MNNNNPFTKEYEFDSSALDVVEKVRQNPIKVNDNPQRPSFTGKGSGDLEWIKKICGNPSVRHIVYFGLERGPDDKNEDPMTCTITCKMTREWMERFIKLLDVMQLDGEIGHSETLSFFADGDGTFRPWFEVSELREETGD